MDLPTTAVKVRAALESAGTTISASRAQDLLFDLYRLVDSTESEVKTEVEFLLSRTLDRGWFKSIEVELLLTRIEASANN